MFSKSAICVWYKNGRRWLLGAQRIHTERASLILPLGRGNLRTSTKPWRYRRCIVCSFRTPPLPPHMERSIKISPRTLPWARVVHVAVLLHQRLVQRVTVFLVSVHQIPSDVRLHTLDKSLLLTTPTRARALPRVGISTERLETPQE